MPQRFLLSSRARSLSLGQVLRLSDEEAHAKFVEIRFADNDGSPFCPRCGAVNVYTIPTRRTWQCKGCKKQFSVTRVTIFASRKLPIRDYLAAIAIFCNEVKPDSDSRTGFRHREWQKCWRLIKPGQK